MIRITDSIVLDERDLAERFVRAAYQSIRPPAPGLEGTLVVTNKTPNAPYRGAGRPETVFAMDRIVDCLARELRMDPAELRRKNYLSEADMPYELGIPYRVGGTVRFYAREEVKDAIAWLALLANGRDEVAFRRVDTSPAGVITVL